MISSSWTSALSRGNSRSAAIETLTKNEVIPNPTPCFCLKDSFWRFLTSMTAVMSTSLKVVSMAAVRCASTRRRAMVCRRRDMRTRSSKRAGAAGTEAVAPPVTAEGVGLTFGPAPYAARLAFDGGAGGGATSTPFPCKWL